MSNTYAIGDVHSNALGLSQVLERSPIKEGDTLVFTGDLFDGFDFLATVDLLFSCQEKYKCKFICGNHDLWLIDYMKTHKPNPDWLTYGGQRTYDGITELLNDDSNAYERLEHLLFTMPFYYLIGNKAFVHGGYTKEELGQEWREDIYCWDRSLWKKALHYEAVGKREGWPLPKILQAYDEIFIGHCSLLSIGENKPKQAGNVWNLDTGAGHSGYLSIMDVNSKEYWQSDSAAVLYPNITPR